MASEKELLDAVKETLQNNGHLGKMRAELRAAVLKILEKKTNNLPKPKVPDESTLVNDLILEYLEWNGYRYTAQMLIAESGQVQTPRPRRELENELGVDYNSKQIQLPLLYTLISQMKTSNQ